MITYLKDLKWGRFNLIAGDLISNVASYYGEWSELEVSVFKQLLDEHSNIIEVGANIGMHTVPLAQIAHRGKVIAFEPQRIIFQQLCCNLALNSITNVESYRLGVSDENTHSVIESCDYSEAWNYGGFSLVHGFSAERSFQGKVYQENIEIVRLDDFEAVQQLQTLTLLKIDAEGLDLKVLKGANQTIKRLQPIIFVEVDLKNPQPLLTYLNELGYAVFWIISERYQQNNFFNSERKENGYDINFLALPTKMLEEIRMNPQTQLSGFIKLLQAVESGDDFAKGKLRWLINIG